MSIRYLQQQQQQQKETAQLKITLSTLSSYVVVPNFEMRMFCHSVNSKKGRASIKSSICLLRLPWLRPHSEKQIIVVYIEYSFILILLSCFRENGSCFVLIYLYITFKEDIFFKSNFMPNEYFEGFVRCKK